MALGGILASALTTHAARSKALFLGGVDVIAEPAATIRYAVPIESVSVTEAGADNVSTMAFTIEASGPGIVNVATGMDVRFEDITNACTDFYGFVDHIDVENMVGNVGTVIHVQCTGIEAILDWSLMAADLVIAAATTPESAVLACVGNAIGNALGRMTALASTNGASSVSGGGGVTNASVGTNSMNTSLAAAVTVTAGTTLREAIRQVSGQVTFVDLTNNAPMNASVDFKGWLRYYTSSGAGYSEGSSMTIDDDPPLTIAQAGDLQYGIDASQVRGVIVKGTGVTAYVSDGSGKPGAVALLVDSTITTAAAAQAAGSAYVSQYLRSPRGQFDMLDMDPAFWTPRIRAGGAVTISDARVGLSAVQFSINTISKTFNPSGREDWVVAFGGNAPSVTALTRQLTRTTLS